MATLTGDNGLLTKAGEAKNTTIESEGLEKIHLAVISSQNKRGINTTSLAKNLSQINNLTDSNNQAITENTEITLPKVIKLNNTSYEINADGEVYKYYDTNGLVLLLDGINNTRNGHSTTTTTWEDLSGNNNDFVKHNSASNAIWSDNSYVGDATNRTLVLNKAILSSSNECTVEVCYDIPQLTNYYWVFQNRRSINPADGFQFCVGIGGRYVELYNKKNNSNYNSNAKETSITDLGKRTMGFALDSTSVIFSDNSQFYTQETLENVINSVVQRDIYSIGTAYPWQGNFMYRFKGNIYSIRVYNRKLSEEELKNNYEIDRLRFNMD